MPSKFDGLAGSNRSSIGSKNHDISTPAQKAARKKAQAAQDARDLEISLDTSGERARKMDRKQERARAAERKAANKKR